jgi:copper chaperone CopZ
MNVAIQVAGMSCGHCAKTIRQAVSVLSGVNRVEVDVARGVVTVDGNYELAAVNSAIADAGYTPQGVIDPPQRQLPMVAAGGCCCG